MVEELFTTMDFGEAVITSTYEGTHSVGSLHYANEAFDVRKPSAMDKEKFKDEHNKEAVRGLKDKLGKDFDIVLEKTHIHIEYDPK